MPRGLRIKDFVFIGDADGHRVDQAVAIIAWMEIGFAADGPVRPCNCRNRQCPKLHLRPNDFVFGMFRVAET